MPTPDNEQYEEIIVPGAFGDEPKTVPLRLGQNGPIIGSAMVDPDGKITMEIPE